MKERVACVLPGGASHVATLEGVAEVVDSEFDVVAWGGVSAGFLVALMAAFGLLNKAPKLLLDSLQENRVLDFGLDGKVGLCRWEVIPRLVDEVLGVDARLGDSKVPLVGVVTSADTGKPVYLSSWSSPTAKCREVARASSALLPLAPMVTLPSLGTVLSPDVRLYYDGGFTDNLPDHVFDHLPERTVSVSLRSEDSNRVRSDDVVGQALSVMQAVTFAAGQRKSRRQDGILIDVDAVGSGLDFDLSPREVRSRINRGRAAAFRQLRLRAAGREDGS